MKNTTSLLLMVLALSFGGCASLHEPGEPGEPVEPFVPVEPGALTADARAPVVPFIPVVVEPALPADCLDPGGRLVTLLSIDNNDTVEHGGIISTALADTGRLVVGSSDGALKTWTLGGDFLATGGGGPIAGYGIESPPGSTPAMDVAFDPDTTTAWAVDASGFLSAWNTDALTDAPREFLAANAEGEALGTPGAAVAVGGGLVFASFMTGTSNNVVWMPTSSENRSPATLRFSYLDSVNDVVFARSAFVAVGRAFGGAALNRFAISSEPGEPLLTSFSLPLPGGSEATSIAISPDGAWLAIGGVSFIAVVPSEDASLGEIAFLELDHPISSVSFTKDGEHIVTVDALSTLRAFDARNLEPGLVQAVPSASRIAHHPSADALVVTRSDGHVDVMSCGRL